MVAIQRLKIYRKVDLSGTTIIIVKIDGGYLVAAEARRTRKIKMGKGKEDDMRIVESENDEKVMKLLNGALITSSGSANRCNALCRYLDKMVTVGDDIISVYLHVADYVRTNPLEVGHRGAEIYIVGPDSERKVIALLAGDCLMTPIMEDYAAIGSGSGHALSELRYRKQTAKLDCATSIKNICAAMMMAIVNDRSSGGRVTVWEVTNDYCGEVRETIKHHVIDFALHYNLKMCSRTELFVFSKSPYEIMNYWYLSKYFESYGFKVPEPNCFGIVRGDWKLFRVQFPSKEHCLKAFSLGGRCSKRGYRHLQYRRDSRKGIIESDLIIGPATKELLKKARTSDLLELINPN